MNPLSDPANATAQETLFPARLLEDGEVILLTVKPSGWFVLLMSWPVLVVVGAVGALAYFTDEFFRTTGSQPAVPLICAAAASLRLVFACFQWVGRVYVLTNRRMMRIGGVMRAEVFSCPLREIREVALTASRGESLLRLGSLHFRVPRETPEARWTHLARPEEVHRKVLEVLRQSR